ncbi:MAG: radical SAM protein [Candidatus Aminicenantes bacterium]|nr:radical SAM protein [Candidatus Aminicenantes bacterium]
MKAKDKLAVGVKIMASVVSGRPRPLFIQYSLSDRCNGQCIYCNCRNRGNTGLTTEDRLALIAAFARLGCLRMKLYGGEPLLNDDVHVLIRAVRSHGMRCAMVTNGLLITEKMEAVREIDELIISLDGDEEAHDRQRGPGTWRRAMDGIEACAAEGLSFFLNVVLTRHSLGQVDWLCGLADRLGIQANFQIPQFGETLFGPHAREWMPSPGEAREVLRKIIALKRSGGPVLFTVHSYRRTLGWKDFGLERIEDPARPSRCMAGRYALMIEPNGDVYPCFQHIGTFRAKNALRDGAEAAWRHAWNHHCHDCYNTWLNENKAIFGLRPEVLMNFWRNYMSDKAKRYRR